MKVGTIIAPKKGSYHHDAYGDFVGRINNTSGVMWEWTLLEEGNGILTKRFGKYLRTDKDSDDLEDITLLYNSPLYEALK